jgi:hypothetical protein
VSSVTLPGQMQPAAADDFTVHTEFDLDLVSGHELGGSAEGVAERNAQKGGPGSIFDILPIKGHP